MAAMPAPTADAASAEEIVAFEGAGNEAGMGAHLVQQLDDLVMGLQPCARREGDGGGGGDRDQQQYSVPG